MGGIPPGVSQLGRVPINQIGKQRLVNVRLPARSGFVGAMSMSAKCQKRT
jgi:hypothetical protein